MRNYDCKWCGKACESKSPATETCSKRCRRHLGLYRIKVLTPPNRWTRCPYCKDWVPQWNKLKKGDRKVFCNQVCSAKMPKTRKKFIGKKITINKADMFDRLKHCFRKEQFGLIECAHYCSCKFNEHNGAPENCKGFADPVRKRKKNMLPSSLGGLMRRMA